MSVNKAFYVARAAECAADAERTALENVRARCLRAEAAWLAMADRLDRIETMRAHLPTRE